MHFIVLVFIFLFSRNVSGIDAPSFQRIFVKTPDTSFSTECNYALSGGRLWVSARNPDPKSNSNWELFAGTGVPFGDLASSFKDGHNLSGFATEGNMVVAVSNTGRFYSWQPTLFRETVWDENLGTPFPQALHLPPNRHWTFSMSLAVAAKKRRTPMRDIVTYYEDHIGNKIEFGFTATIFTLDPNGQVIRYMDTGLPASFDKGFATPERGRFIAEDLSAAGSTLFVIDASGKMYTRMYDYEIFGACPGLRFTFDTNCPKQSSPRPDGVLPIFSAVRVLPLEDWREQPAIPLEAGAFITTNLGIEITGEGNAARELRVQGRNARGEWGYYWKNIFAEAGAWAFQVTGETYDVRKEIQQSTHRNLGPALDKNYQGKLSQLLSADLEVELLDFHYYNSPTTLRVKWRGKNIDLILHTFDSWGPTPQMQANPEMIGTIYGEPKLLVGTLEIPDAILNSTDPDIEFLIDSYFRKLHHAHTALAISANDVKVEIRTRLARRQSTKYLDYAFYRPLKITVTRTQGAEEREQIIENGFTYLASAPFLSSPASSEEHSLREKNPSFFYDRLLARNELFLKEIKRIYSERKKEHLRNGLVAAAGVAVFYPLNALLGAVGLPAWHTLWGGISLTGGMILNQHAAMNLRLVFTGNEDYESAIRILENRIQELFLESMRIHR